MIFTKAELTIPTNQNAESTLCANQGIYLLLVGVYKGPSLKDVRKILPFFDFLFPLCPHIFAYYRQKLIGAFAFGRPPTPLVRTSFMDDP